MSLGTAMSIKNNGSLLSASAPATVSLWTTHSPEPVELGYAPVLEVLDHELAHISCAEDQNLPTGEIPENLLGELHGDARHGERAIPYPCLGADLLADPERSVEKPVEDLACAMLFGRRPVRLADLAEDLTLPDDHRVQ